MVGPTPGEGVTHLLFRCLRDVLLHTELLIPLMFRFSADIGHAGFFVFKRVLFVVTFPILTQIPTKPNRFFSKAS